MPADRRRSTFRKRNERTTRIRATRVALGRPFCLVRQSIGRFVGTGPLLRPAIHGGIPWGGRAGERAGNGTAEVALECPS